MRLDEARARSEGFVRLAGALTGEGLLAADFLAELLEGADQAVVGHVDAGLDEAAELGHLVHADVRKRDRFGDEAADLGDFHARRGVLGRLHLGGIGGVDPLSLDPAGAVNAFGSADVHHGYLSAEAPRFLSSIPAIRAICSRPPRDGPLPIDRPVSYH